MGRRALLGAVLLLAAGLMPAYAEVPAQGSFVASKACPAFQSFRKLTNPGGVMTVPGQSYSILAQNREQPTHYRLNVPGAQPPERWVAIGCGSTEGEAQQQPQAQQKAEAPASGGASYVLAISWQPAFCEGARRKPECRSLDASRFDATHFTLHGLWPQPGTNVYCGVSERDRLASSNSAWESLPPLNLDVSTKAALAKAMPGIQSYLERHEWTKHGSCYPSRDPNAYYRDALRLLDDINTSPVQQLMAANIGRELSGGQIRAAFDQAFGPGAGQRVRLACRDDGGRRLITEVTIGLKGDIPSGSAISQLIQASPATDPGCPGGVVDSAGRQ